MLDFEETVLSTLQVFAIAFGVSLIALFSISFTIESKKFKRRLHRMEDIKYIFNSDDPDDYSQAALFLRCTIGIALGFIVLFITAYGMS